MLLVVRFPVGFGVRGRSLRDAFTGKIEWLRGEFPHGELLAHVSVPFAGRTGRAVFDAGPFASGAG